MKIHKDAVMPKKAHETDACYDLYSVVDDFILYKDGRAKVKTGLIMEIPEGFEGQVRPRSGKAIHEGITVLNSPGTIDSGYRGEICVILYNTGSNTLIGKGDKISQLAIKKVYDFDFVEVKELEKSEREDGGFGSTGT
jgi:dUTP pyrophosphatase